MPEPDELDRLGFTAEEKVELLRIAKQAGWDWGKTVRIANVIMAFAQETRRLKRLVGM